MEEGLNRMGYSSDFDCNVHIQFSIDIKITAQSGSRHSDESMKKLMQLIEDGASQDEIFDAIGQIRRETGYAWVPQITSSYRVLSNHIDTSTSLGANTKQHTEYLIKDLPSELEILANQMLQQEPAIRDVAGGAPDLWSLARNFGIPELVKKYESRLKERIPARNGRHVEKDKHSRPKDQKEFHDLYMAGLAKLFEAKLKFTDDNLAKYVLEDKSREHPGKALSYLRGRLGFTREELLDQFYRENETVSSKTKVTRKEARKIK